MRKKDKRKDKRNRKREYRYKIKVYVQTNAGNEKIFHSKKEIQDHIKLMRSIYGDLFDYKIEIVKI